MFEHVCDSEEEAKQFGVESALYAYKYIEGFATVDNDG